MRVFTSDALKPSIKRARQILMSVKFVVMAFESSHKNRAPLRDKFISVRDYDFTRRDKVSFLFMLFRRSLETRLT